MMTESASVSRSSRLVRVLEDEPVDLGVTVPIVESVRNANSVAGEALRLLRARVLGMCKTGRFKCIAVTSPLPGEGKSTIVLGLATAIAREPGRRVLLVDGDLRRSSLSERLNLPAAPGLSECLADGLDEVTVRQVLPGGFFVLGAGQREFDQPERLSSPQMGALLQAARASFDFVLLDAPPILPVSDTILIQDQVDRFLLVTRSRQTPRGAIVEALGTLRAGKVMGLVFNDHKEYRHSYHVYGYERYGMSYGAYSRKRS